MITKEKLHAIAGSKPSNIDEAIERNWELPTFTMKEIRDAIPSHCFRRDTQRSLSYLFHDIGLIVLLGILASYIDTFKFVYVRILLWIVYWIAQSNVAFGAWVLGHECGHQAFSPSKVINHSVGFVLHTALLTPYHSWRFSHSKHHKGLGHMTKDQAHIPPTRSEVGLPTREKDPQADGPHDYFDETPIKTLFCLIRIHIIGWPVYLLTHETGHKTGGWKSHFNPNCDIFEKSQFRKVVGSIIGIVAMIGILIWCGQFFGSLAVIRYYVLPYLGVNGLLVLVTYLQHTDPKLPRYRDNAWNFQRGAALTIDRSYGLLLNHLHHHIADTHVVHHFFSTMPHYHAQEATFHIKKALGKHYMCDDTPVAVALWNVWRQCRFVEDEGDVVFYKN